MSNNDMHSEKNEKQPSSKNTKANGATTSVENPENTPQNPFEFKDGALHNAFVKKLFTYLPSNSLCKLSQTCISARDWSVNQRLASQMLHAVVKGKQRKAVSLLQSNPWLLFTKQGSATDYSGREYKNISPIQAAFRANDNEMVKAMLMECKDKIDDIFNILQKEIREIYPRGKKAHTVEQRKEENIFRFNEILAAIISASNEEVNLALNKNFDVNTHLNNALQIFRKEFDEMSRKELTFNPQHMLRILIIYHNLVSANINRLGNNKLDLIHRQVVGYAQRYLPASYAEAFSHSIFEVVHSRGYKLPVRRPNNPNPPENIPEFFPLSKTAGLGFDYAFGSGGSGTRGGVPDALCYAPYRNFEKLMKHKNIELGRLRVKEGVLSTSPEFPQCSRGWRT